MNQTNYMTHRDLDVWKEAMDLVCDIYRETKKYPKEEMYGLVSQMRRSSVSVVANISEGAARQGTKEFIRFTSIARSSLSELEAEVLISERLEYITKDKCRLLLEPIESVGIKLSALIRSLREKL